MKEEPYLARQCSSLGDIFTRRFSADSCAGDSVPIGDSTPSSTRGIFYSAIDEVMVLNADDENKI